MVWPAAVPAAVPAGSHAAAVAGPGACADPERWAVPVGAAPALAVIVAAFAAAVGVSAARVPHVDPAAAAWEAAVLCHSLGLAAGQLVLADLKKMLG